MATLVLGVLVGRSSVADDPLPAGGDHPGIALYRHLPEKTTVSGVVVNSSGEVVRGADVYVFGYQRQNSGFPKAPSLELGRGVTDTAGRFSFRSGMMADTRHKLCVIAAGHGAKFVDFDSEGKPVDLGRIVLPAERRITGRVVGPDGNPADNVTIYVRCLLTPKFAIDWFGSPRPDEKTRPIKATTNRDGNFEIRGVPTGTDEIWIRIDDERFALYERGILIGLRRRQGIISLRDDAKKPVEIRLSKPVFVNGVVTRKDTGAPIAGAWVGAAFSDMPLAADSHSAAIWGRTDSMGRYRIRCGPWAPLVHSYVYAPPGTPCPDWSGGPVEVPSGKTEIDLPVVMPIGAVVRGRIVDKATGNPIPRAGYVHILRREKPNTMSLDDAARFYWSNEYHYRYTDADGRFEQPVPAGESGVILVKAPNASYVSKIASLGDILYGKTGALWYVNEGIADIQTRRDTKELTLDIPLARGVPVEGSVVGPEGQPSPKCVVFTDVPLHTHHLQHYDGIAWTRHVVDGRFRVESCDPDHPTDLYFFDPEHQWGATIRFDPKSQGGRPLNVKLEPCGSARVRLVDSKGTPLTAQDWAAALRSSTVLVMGFRKGELEMENRFPQQAYYGRRAEGIDPDRYEKLAPGKDGVVVFPSLIPGAPYKWLVVHPKGPEAGPFKRVSLVVRPGQTTDLGDAVVQRPQLFR